MIDKDLLIKTVEEALEGTDKYLVAVTVSPADLINVEIDSDSNVDIDTCARITRQIESVFDRDAEDYELEVGSAGLTSPLKVFRQYRKNIGNDMEVLTRDGRKLRGVLAEAAEADGGDIAFELEVQTKEKEPGAKRPTLVSRRVPLKASECKYVRYDLKF
ncbi:MAG: ribosome assembly cofactor RimP [Muribaculaceae bacterium]|nr:ribosome assembly cofactor RimP [Muribaculaceae bacterium]